jgi:hypothetical protein
MATTDYLSLLIEQSINIASDIQPLIPSLFALDDLPLLGDDHFMQRHEEAFVPPTQPVRPFDQSEPDPVEAPSLEGQPDSHPRLAAHVASALTSPADILRIHPFRSALIHPRREVEGLEREERRDGSPASLVPSSSPHVASVPISEEEQERLEDRSLLISSLPPDAAQQSAFSNRKAGEQKDETISRREQSGKQGQEAENSMQLLSRKEQPSHANPLLQVVPEENKRHTYGSSSSRPANTPIPSIQGDVANLHHQTSLAVMRQARAENIAVSSTQKEAPAQSASFLTPQQHAIESQAGSVIQREQPLPLPALSGQAMHEPLVNNPAAAQVEVAHLLVLPTSSSSLSHHIRPAQTALDEQAGRGKTPGYREQSAKGGRTARHLLPEQVAREEVEGNEQRDNEGVEQVPLIRVTIGRIEVRATSPQPPALPDRAPATHVAFSLKDYLEQRRRGQS